MHIRDTRTIPVYVVDKQIIYQYAKHLGPYALAVYHAICCAIDYSTQRGQPTITKMAQWLGISRKTVRDCLHVLDWYGLIMVQPILDDQNRVVSHTFTILQVQPLDEDGIHLLVEEETPFAPIPPHIKALLAGIGQPMPLTPFERETGEVRHDEP